MYTPGSLREWIVFGWLGLYRLSGPRQHTSEQHSSLAFLCGLSAGPWLSMWWSTLMCHMAVKTRGCLSSNIYQFFTMITILLSCTSHRLNDFQQAHAVGLKVQCDEAWHILQSMVIVEGHHIGKMWMWGEIVISEQSVSQEKACEASSA